MFLVRTEPASSSAKPHCSQTEERGRVSVAKNTKEETSWRERNGLSLRVFWASAPSYSTNLHEEHEVGTEKEPEDVEITGLLGGIFLKLFELRREGSERGLRHVELCVSQMTGCRKGDECCKSSSSFLKSLFLKK